MLDGAQLEMALLNMSVNSRDAMPEGGELTIRTALASAPDGSPQVLVSVQDTGCGIPSAVLSKVFDPFFTTKANGHGTGLGPSQVYGFASQSGGRAEIRSTPGQGATVTLRFPLSQPDEVAGAASTAQGNGAAPVREDPRSEVLVVEDDTEVRRRHRRRPASAAIHRARGQRRPQRPAGTAAPQA